MPNFDNLRKLKVAIAAVTAGLSVYVITEVAYWFVIAGLIADLNQYGWGHVPVANLNPFTWMSENLQYFLVIGVILYFFAFIYLMYQTAATLDHLRVSKHLNPTMTALSIFIPFYCLYRPWAGLGEVRNTLAAAISRGSIPFEGVRGANGSTVFFSICTALCLVAQHASQIGIERFGDRPMNSTSAATSQLADISFVFLIDALLQIVVLALFLFYWLTFLRQYKEALRVRDQTQVVADPISSPADRDSLSIGSSPNA
jgi:hypothetical protein